MTAPMPPVPRRADSDYAAAAVVLANLGGLLEERRERKGLTIPQAAKAAGVSAGVYRRAVGVEGRWSHLGLTLRNVWLLVTWLTQP